MSAWNEVWAPFKQDFGKSEKDLRKIAGKETKKVKAVCLGQSSKGYGWECLYESSIGHPVCWMCIP